MKDEGLDAAVKSFRGTLALMSVEDDDTEAIEAAMNAIFDQNLARFRPMIARARELIEMVDATPTEKTTKRPCGCVLCTTYARNN